MTLIEAMVKEPKAIITTEPGIKYRFLDNVFYEKKNTNYNQPYWVMRQTIALSELKSIVKNIAYQE